MKDVYEEYKLYEAAKKNPRMASEQVRPLIAVESVTGVVVPGNTHWYILEPSILEITIVFSKWYSISRGYRTI